jgi:hypothetical protein
MKTIRYRRILILIALIAAASGYQASAQDASAPGYSVEVDSVVNFRYLSGGIPQTLGPRDQVKFSVPLWDFTLGLEMDNGLEARITNSTRNEYHLPNVWSLEAGNASNPIPIENNSITLAYISFPFSVGTISLGRQPVVQGPEATIGSLMISPDIPYLDAAVIDIPLGRWSMRQVIATLENRITAQDVSATELKIFVEMDAIDTDRSGLNYDYGLTTILLSSRRFAWQGDALEFGIGAQAILTRDNNAFQLGDVLPIFSIHNGDVGRNNLCLNFDLSLNLIDGHTQYFMAGADDINFNTAGVGDNDIPTIWGLMVGGSGAFDLGAIPLSYALEFAATHYLWGSYDEEYYLSRGIYRLWADGRHLAYALSSPYGPGRISTDLHLGTELPWGSELGFEALLLFGDPDVNLFDTPYTVQASSPEFMLFRSLLEIDQPLVAGFSLGGQLILDALPSGAEFHAGVMLRWQAGSVR